MKWVEPHHNQQLYTVSFQLYSTLHSPDTNILISLLPIVLLAAWHGTSAISTMHYPCDMSTAHPKLGATHMTHPWGLVLVVQHCGILTARVCTCIASMHAKSIKTQSNNYSSRKGHCVTFQIQRSLFDNVSAIMHF